MRRSSPATRKWRSRWHRSMKHNQQLIRWRWQGRAWWSDNLSIPSDAHDTPEHLLRRIEQPTTAYHRSCARQALLTWRGEHNRRFSRNPGLTRHLAPANHHITVLLDLDVALRLGDGKVVQWNSLDSKSCRQVGVVEVDQQATCGCLRCLPGCRTVIEDRDLGVVARVKSRIVLQSGH